MSGDGTPSDGAFQAVHSFLPFVALLYFILSVKFLANRTGVQQLRLGKVPYAITSGCIVGLLVTYV